MSDTRQPLRTTTLVALLAALPTRGKVTIEADQLRTLVNSHLELLELLELRASIEEQVGEALR